MYITGVIALSFLLWLCLSDNYRKHEANRRKDNKQKGTEVRLEIQARLHKMSIWGHMILLQEKLFTLRRHVMASHANPPSPQPSLKSSQGAG